MSDDLKERLANHPEAYSGGLCKEALARIKELETQLATARADALRKAADVARSCALSETSDAHYACGAILAPADATAALQAEKDAVWNEALEKAATYLDEMRISSRPQAISAVRQLKREVK